MKTKKTIIISAIALAIILVSSIIVSIGAIASEDPVKQNLYAAGQIDFGSSNSNLGDFTGGELSKFAYIGEHIAISKEDMQKTTERILLTTEDEQTAFESALRYLASREILYYRAVNENLIGTEEEFFAWFDKYMTNVKKGQNYETDFMTYLSGTGLTEEKYWEQLRESPLMKKEYGAGRFIEYLKEDFSKQVGIEPSNPDFLSRWHEYFESYKTQAILEENLHTPEEVIFPDESQVSSEVQDPSNIETEISSNVEP